MKSEDSPQVARARMKLMKQVEQQKKQITPERLEEVVGQIQQWINRQGGERIPLKERVALFDQNQHSAETSRAVQGVRKSLDLGSPSTEGNE